MNRARCVVVRNFTENESMRISQSIQNTGLYFFLCRAVHHLHVYDPTTKPSSAQNEIPFHSQYPDVVYARFAT